VSGRPHGKVKDLDGFGKEVLQKLILSCGFRDLPLFGLNRNYPNGSHFYSKPVSSSILIGKPTVCWQRVSPGGGCFDLAAQFAIADQKGNLAPSAMTGAQAPDRRRFTPSAARLGANWGADRFFDL
jgi:hypothetical protein